jgi:hypothetical protein
MPDGEFPRPLFIDAIGHSYNRRGKRVILLTGNVLDQFWSPRLKSFTPLEQTLYQELRISSWCFSGMPQTAPVSMIWPTNRSSSEVSQLADRIAPKGQGLGDVQEKMAQTQHQPRHC